MNKREFVKQVARELAVAWMQCPDTAGQIPGVFIVESAVELWDEIEKQCPNDGTVRLPEVKS